MKLNEFIETHLASNGADDVDTVAVIGPCGPGHIMGLVFRVGGVWLHATDYFDDENAFDVNPDEVVVIWTRDES